MLFVTTQPYRQLEAQKIIAQRAKAEGISVDDSALLELANIAVDCSIRYAMNLIGPCRSLANTQKSAVVSQAQIKEVASMFVDPKAFKEEATASQ